MPARCRMVQDALLLPSEKQRGKAKSENNACRIAANLGRPTKDLSPMQANSCCLTLNRCQTTFIVFVDWPCRERERESQFKQTCFLGRQHYLVHAVLDNKDEKHEFDRVQQPPSVSAISSSREANYHHIPTKKTERLGFGIWLAASAPRRYSHVCLWKFTERKYGFSVACCRAA